MFIKQISVFLENKKGSLQRLTKLLGEANIDLLALSIADTEHFGIVRCIVKDGEIDRALEIIRGANYAAKVNKVVGVSVPNRPLGLAEILGIIEEENLSVEYLYSFMLKGDDGAYIAIRLNRNEAGAELLEKRGIKTIGQEIIDNL